MKSEDCTRALSADELARMRAAGEDSTDWERVIRSTDDELEAAIASDPDEAGMTIDWTAAVAPAEVGGMSVRIDADVLDFFGRAEGGHAARINSVLRDYMARAKG